MTRFSRDFKHNDIQAFRLGGEFDPLKEIYKDWKASQRPFQMPIKKTDEHGENK